jgi:tRNA A-37 threonylcarbamoyl transferase component Bud32
MLPFAGQRIGQRFRLLRQVGEGGMASVWLAEDRKHHRTVAVKVLANELIDNAEAVQRFNMEAETIARIPSPYVPRIYGHGTLDDGTPFMVMELLEGVDLDTYVRTHRRLSMKAAVRVVTQVAAVLTETHRLGIVHRDVKPENIFVTGRGDDLVAKLFDFGIAKIPESGRLGAARLTQMNALMGTPNYMSAEQLMSAKDVDARADLWSLAVVAYLTLTGKLPFEGETFGAVCVSVHRGIFERPSRLCADLPPEVDAWISKALSRNPDARFQTAEDMGESFTAAVGGGADVATGVEEVSERSHEVSLWGTVRTRRLAQRRRKGFATAVAVCAGALVYLGAGLQEPEWFSRPIPRSVVDAWSSVVSATGFDRRALANSSSRTQPEVTRPEAPMAAPPNTPPQACFSGEESDAAPRPMTKQAPLPQATDRVRRKLDPTAPDAGASDLLRTF